MIDEYIQNQLEEDLASDQITLKEYIDRLRGGSIYATNAFLSALVSAHHSDRIRLYSLISVFMLLFLHIFSECTVLFLCGVTLSYFEILGGSCR